MVEFENIKNLRRDGKDERIVFGAAGLHHACRLPHGEVRAGGDGAD